MSAYALTSPAPWRAIANGRIVGSIATSVSANIDRRDDFDVSIRMFESRRIRIFHLDD